ncbi:MAG TPA: TIGR00282 family metallophosphoesterase [bacterium]|nr:TIGR00282 family metallophosphoesterase [bacterium]
MTFRILMLGDLIGRPGRKVIRENLRNIIKEDHIDLTVANGENASGGSGLVESAAKDLFESGIDVITSGNHIWNKKEIFSFLPNYSRILRPANYPEILPGKGSVVFEHTGKKARIGVINLLGRVFMHPVDSPVTAAVIEIEKLRNAGADIIVVDFHAEATAEKEALGIHLSNMVELFAGTHTHVQTSDEKIINGHSGYITDLGKCGSFHSVIGFNHEDSIRNLLTSIPQSFVPAKNDMTIEGIVADFDIEKRKCLSIRRFRKFCQ